MIRSSTQALSPILLLNSSTQSPKKSAGAKVPALFFVLLNAVLLLRALEEAG